DIALELVASRTLFTTHTPVAAGHDFFPDQQILPYLRVWAEGLAVPAERLLELGRNAGRGNGLNMTALALRGSRFHNGVSRIHGETASRMETGIWPEVPPEDNPIGHVTNGVHLPTFIAREWVELLDAHAGDAWRRRKTEPAVWEAVHRIPDADFWAARSSMKARMLDTVRRIAERRYRRLGMSATEIDRLTRWIDPERADFLTLGFARRFTGYKRAGLLFDDLARLQRIATDPDRPVVFLFAGKAHPRDENGQRILRQIHRLSRSRELAGRVVLLEDYDLALARELLAGVDVWLNTPDYPLEASGTSGQKAGLNGVLNLSVLDGWWPEGYAGDNGWAIAPRVSETDPAQRRAEESTELLDLLEGEIVPLYYGDREAGYPASWVAASKRSMISLAPRFNAERMVREYARRYYAVASDRGREMESDGAAGAAELAAWKARAREAWPGVRVELAEAPPDRIGLGDDATLTVRVHLAGLAPEDVAVECLLELQDGSTESRRLEPAGDANSGGTLYRLRLSPVDSGPLHYRIRAYPWHPRLTHDLELGCLRWLD
ncbi:MAG: alpha-glucan family phosphorylase, partial [Acidobacteriota bacterium]